MAVRRQPRRIAAEKCVILNKLSWSCRQLFCRFCALRAWIASMPFRRLSHTTMTALSVRKKRFRVSKYCPHFGNKPTLSGGPTDASTARIVVSRIMEARSRVFEARYHRAPTDFEYYILWHRPACLIGRRVPRQLTSVEKERGRRFANLVPVPVKPDQSQGGQSAFRTEFILAELHANRNT